MKCYKNYVFWFIVFCFFSGSIHLLGAKNDQELASHGHSVNSNRVQAIVKQANKLKNKDHKISEKVDNAVDDSDDVDSPEFTANKSGVGTKILIGVGVAGFVAAALVWAVVEKNRAEEQRRLQEVALLLAPMQAPACCAPAVEVPAEVIYELRMVEDILPYHYYRGVEPALQPGACVIGLCADDPGNAGEVALMRLHGGATCCRNCLLAYLLDRYNNDRPNFDRIPFPGLPGQIITRDDIQMITRGNDFMLGAFDRALFERQHRGPVDLAALNADDAAWLREHTRPCPRCGERIERYGGCNHMVCTGCRHEFCYNCLRDFHQYQHAAPDCHAGIFGAGAGAGH